jgi:DNA modification methylase
MDENVFIKKGDIIVFDDKHKLICGDNVDVMKQMQEKSIDVLFTSPPYNDCGTENEDISNIKGSNTHKKYINVEKHENWFEWMCETIDYGRKIAKKYVLFNIQALSNNRENVYKLIGKYSNCIHDILIWHKPNGCPTSTPHKISNKYEMVFIIKAIGVDKVDVNDSVYYNVIKCLIYMMYI